MRNKLLKNILYITSVVTVFYGCGTKEDPAPPNPFDAIIRPDKSGVNYPKPDSHSITGLHQYIFAKSCATPGCHDGHFEPDFRTVQSTYASLVYQPAKKNTPDSAFKYRVIPGDYQKSWLHERLITDNQTLGRMPLYSTPLGEKEMNAVRRWITEGAKDMYGNAYGKPSSSFPNYWGVAAFAKPAPGIDYRVDTLRDKSIWYSPFALTSQYPTDIWFNVADDSVNVKDLLDCEVKLSTAINDFSNAKTYKLTYNAQPKVVPKYWDNQYDGWFWWKATIPAGIFPKESLVFMRVYARNPNSNTLVEIPNNDSYYMVKYFSAFYVAQ